MTSGPGMGMGMGMGRVVSDVWNSAMGPRGVRGWAGLLTDVRGLAGVGELSDNCGLTGVMRGAYLGGLDDKRA